jgi:hypothetical protein
MPALIRSTWVATAVFVATVVVIGLSVGSLVGVGTLSATLVVVTPPVWWWVVARGQRGGWVRGAIAGAVCAAVAFAVPILPMLLGAAKNGPGQELGALATAAGFTVLVGLWAVAIPVGAVVGGATALVQKRLQGRGRGA